MLEKQIEAKVCEYAKEKGILVYKFNSMARAAVPDRLFILPSGEVVFVEFKRLGIKPTPAQHREHERLRAQNVKVFVIDDVYSGKEMVNALIG